MLLSNKFKEELIRLKTHLNLPSFLVTLKEKYVHPVVLRNSLLASILTVGFFSPLL